MIVHQRQRQVSAKRYGKRRLYADLRIAEYWICDHGGNSELNTPPAMWVYRLQPDGRYEQQNTETNTCFSKACGTHVRLWRPRLKQAPRFQWLDAKQDRWRDRETDTEFALQEREMRTAATLLHGLLGDVLPLEARDRVAEAWRSRGLPADVAAQLLAVRAAPDTWHALIDPDTPGDRDNRPPPGGW